MEEVNSYKLRKHLVSFGEKTSQFYMTWSRNQQLRMLARYWTISTKRSFEEVVMTDLTDTVPLCTDL